MKSIVFGSQIDLWLGVTPPEKRASKEETDRPFFLLFLDFKNVPPTVLGLHNPYERSSPATPFPLTPQLH